MHAERSSSASRESVAALVAAAERETADEAWADTFRHGFDRLYLGLDLHPDASTAAGMLESAAATVREVAAECLPLGLALVMHLYPLCALTCVPLPWWSPASLRRSRLLREINTHGLVLANAGSERTHPALPTVTMKRTREGLLLEGGFDYVSLAHVADIVLFHVDDGTPVFCAAGMAGASVRAGASRFGGSMRLSDTCSLRFENHPVPTDHYIEIPAASTLQCIARYQRSWFHLLLGEAHLARIEHLHARWNLPLPPELRASLNELAFLGKYASCLLDEASTAGAVESLARVTAAMKLRISWLAQSTAAAIRERDPVAAAELGYIRRQPTCDARILESLGESILQADQRQKLAS